MWSGPRNISTTMMRAFENRPDAVVADEPLYGAFLATTGADHPYREETLARLPNDWRSAIAALDAPLPAGKTILFEKHIAYHYPETEPLDWLLSRRVFLLVRDPRLMVASYAQKLLDVAPIIDSYRIERRIFDHLAAAGRPCPVVDAADMLADPEGMTRALCAALAIPFSERMLAWPSGPRASDGPWAAHWYDAVWSSTGFRKEAAPRALPVLSPPLEAVAAACEDDYATLRAERLRA